MVVGRRRDNSVVIIVAQCLILVMANVQQQFMARFVNHHQAAY